MTIAKAITTAQQKENCNKQPRKSQPDYFPLKRVPDEAIDIVRYVGNGRRLVVKNHALQLGHVGGRLERLLQRAHLVQHLPKSAGGREVGTPKMAT